MSVTKFVLIFAVLLINDFICVESGVIQTIKDTAGKIKGLFRHGHKHEEHCGESGEITEIKDNTIDKSELQVTSSTAFPQIDIRLGVEETTVFVPDLASRRLLDPGSNDPCPAGKTLGVGGRCRTAL